MKHPGVSEETDAFLPSAKLAMKRPMIPSPRAENGSPVDPATIRPECQISHLARTSRRRFLRSAGVAGAAFLLQPWQGVLAETSLNTDASPEPVLPSGSAPPALDWPHFPDRVHAFVWRNWMLVSAARMGEVLGVETAEVVRMGRAMGLEGPPRITPEQERRSYITVIRRNWHLLPYPQLLQLLGWNSAQMAYALREDDFLFVKLGNLKPKCEPLKYAPPTAAVREREERMSRILRHEFVDAPGGAHEPLFEFVQRMSQKSFGPAVPAQSSPFSPRFCYSYFALYGDPLLESDADPYPDAYLRQLAGSGVDGVWLQAVLHKMAPFPWDNTLSARYEDRLAGLQKLAKRAKRSGIDIYLYLNEPRAMPNQFFQNRAELKGTQEGDFSALCTSHPAVQDWMAESIASICRAVPELGGFFTITASENFTNCWSHGGGKECPRCGKRNAAEVIAEVNGLVSRGIAQAGSSARLIVWDWGWHDDWVEKIIDQLPAQAAFMSVSEWSAPIRRGGIENQVGEYSISTIGPGPRARKHWALARKRGLKTLAKIQAGNTWELSAVPYIPAVENVAKHACNLFQAQVGGLMLGWTLGGYPSPNLQVVAEVARLAKTDEAIDQATVVREALAKVAQVRFGKAMEAAVVQAWRDYSSSFSEFPFDGGVVYNAPLQAGPSNLLWPQSTGYRASMVGIPYDDLDAWRGPYPPEIFIAQLEKVAAGFERATDTLRDSFESHRRSMTREQQQNLSEELNVADAAGIHFRSTANQARFVLARRSLGAAESEERQRWLSELERLLRNELALARRLFAIQVRDSRIGFEASNQYFYVPLDLAEKVLNCRDLLERWLPAQGV